MRTAEELERVAFKDVLTAEEDDLLAADFARRASAEADLRKRIGPLKQAAFFACRAFDKGMHDLNRLAAYIRVLTDVQRVAPSDSFRRKLAEMRSVQMGKDAHGAALKKLARAGEAGPRTLLATDEQLKEIEESLGVRLPATYRQFLRQHAHRRIGTYEPFVASELVEGVRRAREIGLEEHLLPFLDDNGDYFCFDVRSRAEEPAVIFWAHDGAANPETWPNFAAWVEDCWLGELEE